MSAETPEAGLNWLRMQHDEVIRDAARWSALRHLLCGLQTLLNQDDTNQLQHTKWKSKLTAFDCPHSYTDSGHHGVLMRPTKRPCVRVGQPWHTQQPSPRSGWAVPGQARSLSHSFSPSSCNFQVQGCHRHLSVQVSVRTNRIPFLSPSSVFLLPECCVFLTQSQLYLWSGRDFFWE